MTNTLRKKIAQAYRSRLNRGKEKKQAMLEVVRLFGVTARSVYRYCAMFKIGVG